METCDILLPLFGRSFYHIWHCLLDCQHESAAAYNFKIIICHCCCTVCLNHGFSGNHAYEQKCKPALKSQKPKTFIVLGFFLITAFFYMSTADCDLMFRGTFLLLIDGSFEGF